MLRFGVVPVEVPVQRSLDLLAPAFKAAVERTLARLTGGRPEWPFETLRTPERQTFLYGFGRDYDDGRGVVTRATSSDTTWHGYGLAVDVVEKDNTPWDAPATFWQELGAAAEAEGLVWGGRWKHPDRPHLQWGNCPKSPSPDDQMILRVNGLAGIWAKYKADI